jgi:hypothetical protein
MWHIFKQIVHQLATLFAIKLFSPNQVTQYCHGQNQMAVNTLAECDATM